MLAGMNVTASNPIQAPFCTAPRFAFAEGDPKRSANWSGDSKGLIFAPHQRSA